MTTIAQSYASLVDVFKATEDGKKIAAVIELLNQAHEGISDFMAMECNMGAIHRHSIRTGLPSGAWGRLYQGIPQSKSERQQVDDTTGFYEQSQQIDKRLLELAPDQNAFRLSEGLAHYESMNQEIMTGFFYHSTATAPEKFMGLSPRYSSLSAQTGNQIVDGEGTGSTNTSIWFVTHGANDTCVLYPKGTKAGIQHEDKGEQRETDASGNPYYVMEDIWRWHFGVAVKDWRNNARIANIDITALRAGSVDLNLLMTKALYKLNVRRQQKVNNQMGAGRTVIYMNRDCMQALDVAASNRGASDNFVRLKPMELEGREVNTWRGFVIRETDALVNTEARVV